MKKEILEFVHSDDGNTPVSKLAEGADLDTLSDVIQAAREDLPIEQLERLEEVIKFILNNAMNSSINGSDAREMSMAMKKLGLMLKHKPYAVKASNPLGYSVFLQRESEGFSFQNHLEHKTEVFHVLEVLPGGYVFLCDYEDWKKHYEKQAFENWLGGASHPFFDKCRFYPEPGDVFVISELGVVHTVIGCILEEFATASTDMVQRLHDQNDRSSIPDFPRQQIETRLNELSLPGSARRVEMLDGEGIKFENIPVNEYAFGSQTVITDSFVKAAHTYVNPNQHVPVDLDPTRATLIRVFDGQCHVILKDASESDSNAEVDSIEAAHGDTILIPPKIQFEIRNTSDSQLTYSEHRIEPRIAFV